MKKVLLLLFTACAIGCSNNTKQTETTSYGISEVSSIEEKSNLPSLETFKYEILGTNHTSAVENYYVLIKKIPIIEDSLQVFVDAFRKEKCNGSCNIFLLDNTKAYPTIKKYPLSKNEYLMVADRLVAISSPDYTTVSLYPYQDWQYRDYGGKNWKKEPIE